MGKLGHKETLLLMFNMENNEFLKCKLPYQLRYASPSNLKVSECHGTLCLHDNFLFSGSTISSDAWVLKSRSTCSWTKIAHFRVGESLRSVEHFIYLMMNGEFLALTEKRRLVLVNLDTNNVATLALPSVSQDFYHKYQASSFTESLAFLNKGCKNRRYGSFFREKEESNNRMDVEPSPESTPFDEKLEMLIPKTPPMRVFASGDYEFPAPVHSFIMPPKVRKEKKQGDGKDLVQIHTGKSLVLDWVPEYPAIQRKLPDIVEGGSLHVVDFLSNPGKRNHLESRDGSHVQVTSAVEGKYVLICCFLVPQWHATARLSDALIAAYPKLVKQSNFEMVMVAKMRPGFEHDEEAFRHFFSAFPCLAVPFSDSESREFICRSLGLIHLKQFEATLLVHPQCTVLRTNCDFFIRFGAASFPFTAARLADLMKEKTDLEERMDTENEVEPCRRHVPLEGP